MKEPPINPSLPTIAWLRDHPTLLRAFEEGRAVGLPEHELAAVLRKACANKDLDSRYRNISFLLEQGANPDIPNDEGHAALHVMLGASRNDYERAAALVPDMVAHGADVNRTDRHRETPLVALVARLNRSDEQILPVVEAFLAVPSLRLDATHYNTTVGQWIIDTRPRLRERITATARARGQNLS